MNRRNSSGELDVAGPLHAPREGPASRSGLHLCTSCAAETNIASNQDHKIHHLHAATAAGSWTSPGRCSSRAKAAPPAAQVCMFTVPPVVD